MILALGAALSAGALADEPKEAASVQQERGAFNVAFSPDGKTLLSGNQDGTIFKYEVPGLKAKGKLPGKGMLKFLSYTPDGKLIVTVDKKKVTVRDAAGEDEPKTLKLGDEADRWGVAHGALAGDNKTMAIGVNKSVYVWDIEADKQVAKLEGHSAQLVQVAISPDGKKAASAGFGDQTKLWDVAGGKEQAQLKAPRAQPNVQALAWAPTGKSLAMSEEKEIRTFFAGSGEGKVVLTGHTDTVRCLAYSADGKTLVSGGSDKTIRVWDAAEGTLKATITCAEKVNAVALSPDGKIIAAALDTSSKNNVFVYNVSDFVK
ncbi:MAG TPA: WD40 repeat domain-containing protein [Planctomycetota bacterium]|nr:WD40 repeat domain-containing protein [Planctomycetota bacterium]